MAKRTTYFDQYLTTSHNKGVKPCDWPNCRDEAEFRAPKSRSRLNQYYWFCKDHIAVYNKAWNYYAGMSESEIEDDRRKDVTWQRKTWKFGSNTERVIKEQFDDAFGLFDEEFGPKQHKPEKRSVYGAEAKAYDTLQLETDATLKDVKARFKELSKIHHPDANGGDKAAEERFKQINEAYRLLVASFNV